MYYAHQHIDIQTSVHSLVYGDQLGVAVVDEEDVVEHHPLLVVLLRLLDAHDTGPVPDLVVRELG